MNESAFQKFLATGDFTVTEDARPKKDPTLAAHDKRFHPQGYKEGDSCKFREALAKGDNSDASLAAAEKKEAKQKSNIDKYLSMPDDGFAKDVLSLDEKGIKRLESEIKGFLSNSIPNADVKVVKDQPEKGQFAIAVAGTSDDKLMTALSSYPRTGYWSFTDRYEGNNVKLDGDDKPRKYAFLSFKAKAEEQQEGEWKTAAKDPKLATHTGVIIMPYGKKPYLALDRYGAEKDSDLWDDMMLTPHKIGTVLDRAGRKAKLIEWQKTPDGVVVVNEEAEADTKQKKIAKLQKLHEDYNKWFETADRGDIHAWLEEEEKRVKDLKDALEGLEIGKDIQWDSDKRNFYALSDKKDKPTFNPDNRFHMAEDDDLWRRRNEGDSDAKRLTDLVSEYGKERQWRISGEDMEAYVQAFRDMDADKFPQGLPELSDTNEARKRKFASVVSSRPELIRPYIIERFVDVNYHDEAKALSEGRYDDVMED